MSWQPTTDPDCIVESTDSPIDTVIVPRRRDVGGFDVMRALPSAERSAVGPFVFFDQFGPLQLIQGKSLECVLTRISVWQQSPTCLPARSCTAIISGQCSQSSRVKSIG